VYPGNAYTITLSVDMTSDNNAAAYAIVQDGNATLGITSGLNALLNF